MREEENRWGRHSMWKHWRWQIVAAVLLIVGGYEVVLYFSPRKRISQPAEGRSEEAAARSASATKLTLPEILDRHYEATGGFDRQTGLKSVKMRGEMRLRVSSEEEEFRTFEMILLKKSPNLVRVTLVDKGVTWTMGYNGSEIWSGMETTAGRRVEILDKRLHEGFIRDAAINSHLFEYRAKGCTLTLMKSEKIDGRECHVIAAEPKSGSKVVYYLDSQTYYERKVESWTENGGNRLCLETVPSEYRFYGAIVLPGRIENYENGKLRSQIDIEDASFDIGLVPEVFDAPGDAGTTSPSVTGGAPKSGSP